jgi:ABC-type transporter Mla subunit MlaD
MHALQETLQRAAACATVSFDRVNLDLQAVTESAAALLNAVDASRREIVALLTDAPAHVPATLDVLEHSHRGLHALQRACAGLDTMLQDSRAALANAVVAHHHSVIPHMTPQERELVQKLNPYVPREEDPLPVSTGQN